MVSKLTSIWCKAQKENTADCKHWWDEFASSFAKLLIYDMASYLQKDGLSVLGDNCTKFMVNEKSCSPDKNKISAAENSAKTNIKRTNETSARKAITKSALEWHTIIRGHFLASGVIKYIANKLRSTGKGNGLSYDALYSSALATFASMFNERHPHFGHYEALVRRIETTL